jgi:hypothetical protein
MMKSYKLTLMKMVSHDHHNLVKLGIQLQYLYYYNRSTACKDYYKINDNTSSSFRICKEFKPIWSICRDNGFSNAFFKIAFILSQVEIYNHIIPTLILVIMNLINVGKYLMFFFYNLACFLINAYTSFSYTQLGIIDDIKWSYFYTHWSPKINISEVIVILIVYFTHILILI